MPTLPYERSRSGTVPSTQEGCGAALIALSARVVASLIAHCPAISGTNPFFNFWGQNQKTWHKGEVILKQYTSSENFMENNGETLGLPHVMCPILSFHYKGAARFARTKGHITCGNLGPRAVRKNARALASTLIVIQGVPKKCTIFKMAIIWDRKQVKTWKFYTISIYVWRTIKKTFDFLASSSAYFRKVDNFRFFNFWNKTFSTLFCPKSQFPVPKITLNVKLPGLQLVAKGFKEIKIW